MCYATLVLLALLSSASTPASASGNSIPYFARRYGVSCQACHVAPPKLNAFGEEFVARGYEMPSLTPRRTWPFALWVSGRSDHFALPPGQADAMRAYLNRVELISGGKIVAPWLSYFVEWRPVSQESRSNGTLRDRSGRFEDLFVTAARSPAELTVGQFRQLAQVDVSRRLGLSEPLVLSASLPGRPGGTSREVSLRGFAPSGRSPAVRAALNSALASGWRWTTSASLPVPGELSIPLTDTAKVEASNEIEWRGKGVLVESFARRGLASLGAHVFYDRSDRYLSHAIVTASARTLQWTGIAGVAKTGPTARGRWSLETEYLPHQFFGVGARVEDQAADGAGRSFLPYVNAHFPGTSYTVRLTAERRVQKGRHATFIEVGTVF